MNLPNSVDLYMSLYHFTCIHNLGRLRSDVSPVQQLHHSDYFKADLSIWVYCAGIRTGIFRSLLLYSVHIIIDL